MDINCRISQILKIKIQENSNSNTKNGENNGQENSGNGQYKSNMINIGQPSYYKHGNNLEHALKTKRNINLVT